MAAIKKTTYKDQVIEYVYEFILDGRYLPGDQIKEGLLAKELGISRAPVREALKELIVNGIIDYRPQVGSFIALLSPKQIRDAYTTRGILEGYAIMSTRDRFSEDDFEELKALVVKMRKAAERGNKKMVVQVGDEFHNLLVSKNDNSELAEYMDRLSLKLHVLFCKYWSDLYSPTEIGDRHMRIVTSLMSGDPEVIEQTVRQHYTESGDKIAAISRQKDRQNEA
jgi:DNA-binding GntR family transcriptional regulator